MKKFLPKIVLLSIAIFLTFGGAVYAVNTLNVGNEELKAECGTTPLDQCTVRDKDVEFAAKTAARSKEVLEWATQKENYLWMHLKAGQNDPLEGIWVTVRNIVYAMLGIAILVAAFLLIITRGKSLTVKKFVPRFIFVIIFVALSFSLAKTLYDVSDIIEGFFLTKPDDVSKNIDDSNLLHVGFPYDYNEPGRYIGFRFADHKFDEQVWVTTLLLKLTAASYYGIFAVLALRKIILWFFLIISPILPLLFLFPLVRNSAKLWIGEFFRWLLYAPLFALFLKGLVLIWRSDAGIPLGFNCIPTDPNQQIFKTATDVLLGGPCQVVSATNNLNSPETFTQYLIALLMLWVVIVLPFILLKIFLDYLNNFSITESNIVKYLAQTSAGGTLAHYGMGRVQQSPPGSPAPAGSAGLAKNLPAFEHSAVKELETRMAESAERQQQMATSAASSAFERTFEQTQQAAQSGLQTPLKVSVEEARSSSISALYPKIASNFVANISAPMQQAAGALQQAATEVMNLTSLTIPTMRDIVRYETSTISGEAKEETSKLSEIISRIAGTSAITTPAERQRYSGIKEKLVVQAQSGNAAAFSVISAAVPADAQFPEANRVQQVSLDDYEQVKKLWMETYRKLEPPAGPDGRPQDRKNWLKQEIKKIPEVIDLLLSGDPEKVKRGKEMVNKILPFLLLGGFSLAEIVAYLKAKLEAAKTVMNEVLQIEQDEESKVKVEVTPKVESKTMSAEIPEPGIDKYDKKS